MQKLELVLLPDESLRKVCNPLSDITEATHQLIENMFHTMYEAPGIGLAAPQIGCSDRIIVVDVSEEKNQPVALINPEIIESAGEITWEEGCLSIPGIYAEVRRPSEILVRGINPDGKEIEFEAKDLFAVCLQHEIDHLNGKLFIDHLSNLKKSRLLDKYRKQQEDEAKYGKEE